jgi:hypothetical protein
MIWMAEPCCKKRNNIIRYSVKSNKIKTKTKYHLFHIIVVAFLHFQYFSLDDAHASRHFCSYFIHNIYCARNTIGSMALGGAQPIPQLGRIFES